MFNKIKGLKELLGEVIETGLCALCGACIGDCPYLVFYKGKIRMLDFCTRSEGHCYGYCPRTYVDMDRLSKGLFSVPFTGSEIGVLEDVFMARSKDARTRSRAQYGGTVTTLLSVALDEVVIQKALLAKTTEEKLPVGFIASTHAEALQGGGSNYMAYPAIEALNRMPRESKDKLGIVATPCQALALAKMRLAPPEQRADMANLKLVIGLFCTWALSYNGFYNFLKENLDLSRVKKFDIPPPPANRFDVFKGKEVKSYPLDEIRNYRMPTCAYCLDMTAEFADVSVGAVEGIEGWNTVIVRTQRGAEIIDLARKAGKLQIDSLPAQNLSHLKEASLLKKTRSMKEIVKKTGDKNNLLYLGMPDDVRDKLLS